MQSKGGYRNTFLSSTPNHYTVPATFLCLEVAELPIALRRPCPGGNVAQISTDTDLHHYSKHHCPLLPSLGRGRADLPAVVVSRIRFVHYFLKRMLSVGLEFHKARFILLRPFFTTTPYAFTV